MSNLVADNDILEENELDRIIRGSVTFFFLYKVCKKSSLA